METDPDTSSLSHMAVLSRSCLLTCLISRAMNRANFSKTCQKLNQISQHDSIKQEEINVVLLILNRTVLIPVSKARMHQENRHLTTMSHMLQTYHPELCV